MQHAPIMPGLTTQARNLTNSADSPVAPSPGEIVDGLNALNEIINVLESNTVRLTNRLMPVTRPAAPGTGGEDVRPEPLSPFAQELRRLDQRIYSICALIADTDLRLELP